MTEKRGYYPPRPRTAQVQPLITLYSQGQFQEVLNEAFQMLTIFPKPGNFVQSYCLIAKIKDPQIEKAISLITKFSNHLALHYNIGIVLQTGQT